LKKSSGERSEKEGEMKREKKRGFVLGTWGIMLGAIAASALGCATMEAKKPDLVPTGTGEEVFMDKYEFKKPPEGWALIKGVENEDFEFGFIKFEKGKFPSQTTFVYDSQPYGSSQDLAKRAEYYCTRFLFNSGIDLRVTKREKLTINDRPAMALYMEGENPVAKEKAKSKIYLVKRGDRIVSFICTQWRPINETFSEEPFDKFESFVRSFKFLKKDFYQNFEEKLKKAGL
jgi:hypothetical protein